MKPTNKTKYKTLKKFEAIKKKSKKPHYSNLMEKYNIDIKKTYSVMKWDYLRLLQDYWEIKAQNKFFSIRTAIYKEKLNEQKPSRKNSKSFL